MSEILFAVLLMPVQNTDEKMSCVILQTACFYSFIFRNVISSGPQSGLSLKIQAVCSIKAVASILRMKNSGDMGFCLWGYQDTGTFGQL